MTPPGAEVAKRVEPTWGLGDAAAGWVIAQVSAAVLGVLIIRSFGYSTEDASQDRLSMVVIALQYPPLWAGFVGVPVVVSQLKGLGWIRDFKVSIALRDVAPAAALGVAAQLVIVPLISWPFVWLSGSDFDDLGESARNLAEKASSGPAMVLLFLVVVVGAPLAEELFFRGLLLRAIEKRFGLGWAVAGSSAIFGATHFQLLQFPALTAAGLVFGVLAARSSRLGPAVVAHMAFNAVTIATLFWGSP